VSDFLNGLEHDLVEAARRRARISTSRRSWRPFLLAAAAALLVGGSAAAATLTVLRGSPIPAPDARDLPPEQTPAPGSSTVATLRAADPDSGAPPWTLRLARSTTGLPCSTEGQVVDGDFGLIGLDGRFRVINEGAVDSCGEARQNAASLIGARVFDAARPRDVRTVVSGVAGADLRAVTVEGGGERQQLPIEAGGVFATALRGYPEDIGVRATLRFADGHRERHAFGASAFVVADPAGGRAWKTSTFAFGGQTQTCVSFQKAREIVNPPVSPATCGRWSDQRHRRGYFFGVRRVYNRRREARELVDGSWKGHPPRTAVYGAAGEDVRRVEVIGPKHDVRDVQIAPSRAFLALYGPDVSPASLTVRIVFADGRVETRHGDANLVAPPRFHR
jgi:hypothetical protein